MKMAIIQFWSLKLGPNQSPKTSPSPLGKFRVLWSWTLSMDPGHIGEVVVHVHFNGPMDPLEPQNMGPVWPWGTLITPMDCGVRTVGHTKDQKGPKKPLVMY
ncbi:hypothetical protein O181_034122 [Austropuccinia psidii MF-1]|uniref:Uncharacterized protein n=1 Tax=Austropuccinia psidii MF-1 TaxID=1389203 RepID=A0A9Q3D2M6_9BASI|nr:hypothetical protein [Austropuccinia psidii MF-1]